MKQVLKFAEAPCRLVGLFRVLDNVVGGCVLDKMSQAPEIPLVINHVIEAVNCGQAFQDLPRVEVRFPGETFSFVRENEAEVGTDLFRLLEHVLVD